MNKEGGVAAAPLPWQQQQWNHLYQCHQADRLAHALLLTGQIGLGKDLFAAHFAKTLLCKQSSISGACQYCRDCSWVAANTHPDLSRIAPEKISVGIKIEQIRKAMQSLNQTTSSLYKIFIINPADGLFVASSNALLKSLEEPTSRTLFILITDKPGLLLPTVRSRCQIIRFTPPHRTIGKDWLRKQLPDPDTQFLDGLYELADAAPLQAVAYAKTGLFEFYQCLLRAMLGLLKKEIDPIQLAESYIKTDSAVLLRCLMKIVCAVLTCKLQIKSFNSESLRVISVLANAVHTDFLFEYFDKLLNLQRAIKIALNQQLMLEDLFCCWSLREVVSVNIKLC